MAKYTGANVVIKVDVSEGGALQDMSQYITEFNGVSIEAVLEESHTFGDSWVEQTFAGIKKLSDITFGGFYDDTASTGPDAVFGVGSWTAGASRTVEITYGSTKKSTFEAVIKSYTRTPSRGALTKFQVVMSPTGAVTEA